MAITISLTGRLADITSRPVGQITSAYIKAPVATVGQGLDITLSQPVPVVFDADGVFTVDVVDGLGWLFVQGVGWTESVRFVAAAGMTQMWEAIVNAMPESTGFSRYIQNMQAVDASVSEAEAAASSASSSATNAARSASAAATSATNADSSATNAAGSAAAASQSAQDASSSATNAASSATNAKTSETNAASSESNAASSETSASRSAADAATSASEAATSESNAKTSETNAVSSASAASGSAAAADQSAQDAAQSAANAAAGVPDATSSVKGKIKLAGDLGGTADAPTVPGLASKADLVGGFVPTSQLPAVALTKPQVVPDRAGMLALTAQEGDVAVITAGVDKGTYMLGSGASTNFASWVALAAPTDAVSSVNGQTGVVNLSASNVGAAPSSHTHTSAQISDAVSTATASRVIRRDSAGRAQVADPSAAADVSTKNYVDVSIINAPKLHTWDGSGSWVAPANAGPNDLVLNTATKEIFSVQVV